MSWSRNVTVLAVCGALVLGCTGPDPAPTPAPPAQTARPTDRQGGDRFITGRELKAEPPDSLAAARRGELLPTHAQVMDRLTSRDDQDWYRFHVSSTTRMSAVLGRPLADLALKVYDAGGREVASSDHPGKQFERVYWNAVPGDYLAQVTSATTWKASQAAKYYRFWFRQLPAGLVVESWTIDPIIGELSLIGEVLNPTPSWMRLDAVRLDALGGAGQVLATRSAELPVRVIKPYGKVTFDYPLPPELAGSADWRLRPQGTPMNPPGRPQLRLEQDRPAIPGDLPADHGLVHNDGTTATDGATAVVVHRYYDRNGVITGVEYGSVPAIPAGGSAAYRIALGRYVPNRLEVELVTPIR